MCGLIACVCVLFSKHPVFQAASVCILENKKAHTISLMWCYSCAIFSPLSPDRRLCLYAGALFELLPGVLAFYAGRRGGFCVLFSFSEDMVTFLLLLLLTATTLLVQAGII